jgi:hypothetical protein
MKSLFVEKKNVKYRLSYISFGIFVTLCSWGTAQIVWDDIFFYRASWLTRKNLLKHLLSEPKIKYYKNSQLTDFRFEFEDGSNIAVWWKDGIVRSWSFYNGEGNSISNFGTDISTKVLDRQIQDEIEKLVELVKVQESKK